MRDGMTGAGRSFGSKALVMALYLVGATASAADMLVADQLSFDDAVAKLRPGNRLVLADGNWRDFEMVFEAQGTTAAPIGLVAETPGKVRTTGRSNLSIGGQHLIVSGLTFTQGASPTDAVIAFRAREDGVPARYVRLTQTVIEGFNKEDCNEQDSRVVLYGQNNIVDHNALLGKTNKGHAHHHAQMAYVVSGRFEVTVGEETRTLKAGDSFYVVPDVMHGAVCEEAGELLDVFSPWREDFLSKGAAG